MYENKEQPLASRITFYQRVLKNILLAGFIMAICLVIGVLGYHYTDNVPWIDAFHNASMILSGMGPVITITSDTGKIFSSLYALFSGVVFITNVGIILTPALHRLWHSFHIEDN